MFDTLGHVIFNLLAISGAFFYIALGCLFALACYDSKHPQYSLLRNMDAKHREFDDEDEEHIQQALSIVNTP